jgi:hypothetical protein
MTDKNLADLQARFGSMGDFGPPASDEFTVEELIPSRDAIKERTENEGGLINDETLRQPAAGSVDTTQPQVSPVEALRQANMSLDARRHELRQARNRLTSARARVAAALQVFNRSAPPYTAQDNIRDHLRGNQERKAALAAAGQLPYRPTVGETARALAGGGMGVKRGGGVAYKRGAVSLSQAATINALHARRKLPSEK